MQFERVEEQFDKKIISSVIANRYQVLEKIGEGGMGVVYKAKHNELGRIHAVKVLRAKACDDEARERFRREGQIAASLNHPSLVAVYDCGVTDDGYPFLVMDFVEGTNLADMIERFGSLSADVALPLFVQICRGLSYAHDKGIVHRDLKPANIMIVSQGRSNEARIMDFGIAKVLAAGGEGNLTKTGEVFGSLYYMSPEQCSGQVLDGRTDIYSLGCLMYETLSGIPPLAGENPVQTIYKHMNERPKSFSEINAAVPKEIEEIIFKCMEKDPDRRFHSADEMAAAMNRLRDGVHEANVDVAKNYQQNTSVSSKNGAASAGKNEAASSAATGAQVNEKSKTELEANQKNKVPLLVQLLVGCCIAGLAFVFGAQFFGKQTEPVPNSQAPSAIPLNSQTPPALDAEKPWTYSQTKDGLQIWTNPSMAGQPETIVVYVHQTDDQGRSQDNDYIHMGHVTVNVPERKTNSVLVLAGFSPKVWNLKIAPGTKIVKIILSGLHKQTVKGAPEGVKILASSDRAGPTGSTPKDYYETLEAGEVPFPNYTLSLMSNENILENSSFNDMRANFKKLAGRDISTLIYADKSPKEIDL